MSTIASLAIDLKANIANFQAGMSDAQKSLKEVQESVESTRHVLEALGAIEIGGKLVEHLEEITKAAFNNVESTYELAKASGATTEGIGGLRRAAEEAGVSAETMDGAILRLNRSLGDAAMKGGPAADALKQLGLSARELTGMRANDAFNEIAEAITKVQSPAERARLAVELFGKSGAQLLPVLLEGKHGLEEAAAAALQTGEAFTQIDAEKVHQASLAMKQLEGASKGLGNQIAIELSPYIVAAVAKFREMTQTGESMGSRVHSAIQSLKEPLAVVADSVQVVYIGFKALQLDVTAAITVIVGAMEKLNAATLETLALLKMPGAKEAQESSKLFFDNLTESLKKNADELEAATKAGWWGDKLKNTLNSAEGSADALAKSLANLKEPPAGIVGGEKSSGFDSQVGNAQKILEGLQRRNDALGESAAQAKAAEVAQLALNAAMQYAYMGDQYYEEALGLRMIAEEAQKAADRIDAFEAAKKAAAESERAHQKLMEEGKHISEEVSLPAEKYADAVEHLHTLLNAGAIDWEHYRLAVKKAHDEMEHALGEHGGSLDLTKESLFFGGAADPLAALLTRPTTPLDPWKQGEELFPLNNPMPGDDFSSKGMIPGLDTSKSEIEVKGQDKVLEALQSIKENTARHSTAVWG